MVAPSETKRVFISHSHNVADRELYRDVARRLKSAGLEPVVVKAKAALEKGHLRSIRQAISQSEEVLFLLTPAALENSWPLVELGAAEGMEKEVLLVLFGLSKKQLPAPFRDYEPVPYDRLEKAIGRMSRRLNSVSDGPNRSVDGNGGNGGEIKA